MKRLGIALAITTIIACQSEKKSEQTVDSAVVAVKEAPDSLTFQYDSVKVYSKNPVSANASVTDTAKAVISYPVFSDKKINDFVKEKIMGTAEVDRSYSSYDAYAKGFMKGFDDFQKDNKDRIQTWFLDIDTKVLKQSANYLSLQTTYINFSGGAHPNSAFSYQNYNPLTHQEVILDSLLLPGSLAKLTAVAERIFRKNEKLSPTASLKDGYFFENDTFKLNSNFTITDDGLLFLYNPYEIKAYAYGVTKLLIPFTELKDIANPIL